MRGALTIAVCVAVVVAGCGGGGAKPRGTASAPVASWQARERVRGPLLGIVTSPPGGPGFLARLAPGTLEPAPAGRVRVRGYLSGWGRSPDGRALALGVGSRHRGRVQFVDLLRWRTRALLELRRGEAVGPIAWVAPDRVLGLVGDDPGSEPAVLVIDPVRARVLRRVPLGGEVVVAEPSALGLLLVLGRPGVIAPATLVRVDPAGRVHRTPLARIAAGSVPPRPDLPEGAEPLERHAVPGLAVDEPGRRAFVVAAGDAPVAQIDLRSGRVAYHELREHVSLLGRLRDWLEPAAQAKAGEGAMRSARWLGNGRLSVAGQDESADGHVQPFGVRLVNAADWTWRTLDPDGDRIVTAPGALLVAGVRWDESTRTTSGTGLTVYNLDGSRRFHRLGARPVARLLAAGRYAYASISGQHRTHVIDLRTGRTLRVLPTAMLPILLVP